MRLSVGMTCGSQTGSAGVSVHWRKLVLGSAHYPTESSDDLLREGHFPGASHACGRADVPAPILLPRLPKSWLCGRQHRRQIYTTGLVPSQGNQAARPRFPAEEQILRPETRELGGCRSKPARPPGRQRGSPAKKNGAKQNAHGHIDRKQRKMSCCRRRRWIQHRSLPAYGALQLLRTYAESPSGHVPGDPAASTPVIGDRSGDDAPLVYRINYRRAAVQPCVPVPVPVTAGDGCWLFGWHGVWGLLIVTLGLAPRGQRPDLIQHACACALPWLGSRGLGEARGSATRVTAYGPWGLWARNGRSLWGLGGGPMGPRHWWSCAQAAEGRI